MIDDLEFAKRMVSETTELGRWLAHERQALRDALGREATPREFVDHVLDCLHVDPAIRAMAIEAVKQARGA